MSKNNTKLELNENGVSAKKAEECLAASTETGLSDLGQSGSVPVGQKDICAPHLEADQLKENKDEKAEKAETCSKQDVKSEKADKAEKAESCDKHETKSEKCDADSEKAKNAEKSDNSEHKTPPLDLNVAAGLALMVADQAGKVLKDVTKNFEDKIDSMAEKAHEAVDSAQRTIKDPVGETLKQVEHFTHHEKEKEKAGKN